MGSGGDGEKGMRGKGGSRALVISEGRPQGARLQTKGRDRDELRKRQTPAKWALPPKSRVLSGAPRRQAEEPRRLTRGSAVPGQGKPPWLIPRPCQVFGYFRRNFRDSHVFSSLLPKCHKSTVHKGADAVWRSPITLETRGYQKASFPHRCSGNGASDGRVTGDSPSPASLAEVCES